MTLIDLPRITHVDAANENFDIHAVTSAMVHKYVKNHNMIVLVVIPANDDFGNSEALRIAQTYDPGGSRTIGVISKCDLVPDKSDILGKIQMTRENDVKLSLGFIAITNKGPGEEDIDIEAAESIFFSSHKVLRLLRPFERGCDSLSRKIVELQGTHLSSFIPEARHMVRQKIIQVEQQLHGMGSNPSSAGERRSILVKKLWRYRYYRTRLNSSSRVRKERN